MLKDRRKLNSNSLKPRNSLIHTPKVYKSKVQKKSHKRALNFAKIFLNRTFYVFILFLIFSSLFYLFLRVKSNNKAYDKTITHLENCKDYKKDKEVHSVLRIRKDSLGSPIDFSLLIFDKNKKSISIGFTETVFNIDKNGKKGTLKDYFALNSTYLDVDSIVKNLPGLFLSNFYIKVDTLIIEKDYRFDTYAMRKNAPFYSKLLNSPKVATSQYIQTSVCKKTWGVFTGEYKNVTDIEARKVNYTENFRLADYFPVSEVKKEQVRVQIVNKSGVESLGIFYQKFFENYGISVVKNDISNENSPTTKISYDGDFKAKKNTIEYLGYILDREDEGEVSKNLFSDLTVTLGEDSVVNY